MDLWIQLQKIAGNSASKEFLHFQLLGFQISSHPVALRSISCVCEVVFFFARTWNLQILQIERSLLTVDGRHPAPAEMDI